MFARFPDAPVHDIPLVDYLMSWLALFVLKYISLLQFDHDRQDETTRANLRTLYEVERAPGDTRFRERLDDVAPSDLSQLYTALFRQFLRGKGFEGFAYLYGHYQLSLDGTDYFSSKKVHCASCAEKNSPRRRHDLLPSDPWRPGGGALGRAENGRPQPLGTRRALPTPYQYRRGGTGQQARPHRLGGVDHKRTYDATRGALINA